MIIFGWSFCRRFILNRMRTNYVASTPRIHVLHTLPVQSFVGTTRNNELRDRSSKRNGKSSTNFNITVMGCPYQAWFPQSNPIPPLFSLISQALKGFHQRELACLLSILPKQKKSHLLKFSYDLGLIPWPESKGKSTWGLGPTPPEKYSDNKLSKLIENLVVETLSNPRKPSRRKTNSSTLGAFPKCGGFCDIFDWLSCIFNKLFNGWHVESDSLILFQMLVPLVQYPD